MASRGRMAAILAVVALGGTALACNRAQSDRQALRQDEVNRQVDLALKKDSGSTTLEDTSVAPAAAPAKTAEPRPAPRPPVSAASAPSRQPKPAAETPPSQLVRTTEPEPAPAPTEVTYTVSVGTSFTVALDQMLSTSTNKVGDAFTATVAEPVLDADGGVAVPVGAKVNGTVTGVQKSGHVGETAVIKLAIESVTFDGDTYPMEASVVEAHPERRNRTTTAQNAVKVGAGAAAGAILGKVLGRGAASVLTGAAIGAAAGTAIALGTEDVDAVLPSGSKLVLRTDSVLVVKRLAN
jgi:hypothetical protein